MGLKVDTVASHPTTLWFFSKGLTLRWSMRASDGTRLRSWRLATTCEVCASPDLGGGDGRTDDVTVVLMGAEAPIEKLEEQMKDTRWDGTGVGYGVRGARLPDLTIRLEGTSIQGSPAESMH